MCCSMAQADPGCPSVLETPLTSKCTLAEGRVLQAQCCNVHLGRQIKAAWQMHSLGLRSCWFRNIPEAPYESVEVVAPTHLGSTQQ